MNALIKSSDSMRGGAVRPLGIVSKAERPPEVHVDRRLLALEQEVQGLRADVSEQEAVIERHKDELEAAYARGEAAGREAGLKEADEGRAALISRIEGAVEAAVETLGAGLSSLERLAGLLAVEGLQKILGQSDDRKELVLDLIRNQAAGLRSQAVVRVDVSPLDFPEPEHRAEVQAALAQEGVEVRVREGLKSGDCDMKLQLGAIEVGIDQQWGRLRDVLAGLAEPGRVS